MRGCQGWGQILSVCNYHHKGPWFCAQIFVTNFNSLSEAISSLGCRSAQVVPCWLGSWLKRNFCPVPRQTWVCFPFTALDVTWVSCIKTVDLGNIQSIERKITLVSYIWTPESWVFPEFNHPTQLNTDRNVTGMIIYSGVSNFFWECFKVIHTHTTALSITGNSPWSWIFIERYPKNLKLDDSARTRTSTFTCWTVTGLALTLLPSPTRFCTAPYICPSTPLSINFWWRLSSSSSSAKIKEVYLGKCYTGLLRSAWADHTHRHTLIYATENVSSSTNKGDNKHGHHKEFGHASYAPYSL